MGTKEAGCQESYGKQELPSHGVGGVGGVGTDVGSVALVAELLEFSVKLLDSSFLATKHLLLVSLFSLSSLVLSCRSDFALETKSIVSAGSARCSLFRDARSRACISSSKVFGTVSYHFPTEGRFTHSLPGSHK